VPPTTRILSPRGSVIFETRTNQLFVSDIPSKLEEIQSLIAKIDIPVRQVLIEARIVEADDSFGRALGVKLGGTDLRGLRAAFRVGRGRATTTSPSAATIRTRVCRPAEWITATSYLPTIRSSSTCRPTPQFGVLGARPATLCAVAVQRRRPTAS
jgi:type II secretory pathway component HofQ